MMFDTSSVAEVAVVAIAPSSHSNIILWHPWPKKAANKIHQRQKKNKRSVSNGPHRYHRFIISMSVKCWPSNYWQIKCIKKRKQAEKGR